VDTSAPPPASPAPRPFGLPRAVWHLVGLLLAVMLAWLVLRGYRQPELLLDIANLRLC
jgi:hypothetical protein